MTRVTSSSPTRRVSTSRRATPGAICPVTGQGAVRRDLLRGFRLFDSGATIVFNGPAHLDLAAADGSGRTGGGARPAAPTVTQPRLPKFPKRRPRWRSARRPSSPYRSRSSDEDAVSQCTLARGSGRPDAAHAPGRSGMAQVPGAGIGPGCPSRWMPIRRSSGTGAKGLCGARQMRSPNVAMLRSPATRWWPITATSAAGGTEIFRLAADGKVHIFSPTQNVYGDRAVYDVDKRSPWSPARSQAGHADRCRDRA